MVASFAGDAWRKLWLRYCTIRRFVVQRLLQEDRSRTRAILQRLARDRSARRSHRLCGLSLAAAFAIVVFVLLFLRNPEEDLHAHAHARVRTYQDSRPGNSR